VNPTGTSKPVSVIAVAASAGGVARRVARQLQETSRGPQFARYRHDVAEAEKRAEILRGLMDDLVQGVSTSHDEGANGDTVG
jgi:hypothetical protein